MVPNKKFDCRIPHPLGGEPRSPPSPSPFGGRGIGYWEMGGLNMKIMNSTKKGGDTECGAI